MGVPYEMSPVRGLIVPGGQTTCFTILFPSRTLIAKVIIAQVNGVLVNFAAQLYNHAGACEDVSISESVGPEEGLGALPPELFKVGPLFNGVNGYMEYFSDAATGGFGLVFFNQDGRDDTNKVRPQHVNKIYLKISPAGSGNKEFAVAMAGMKYE